MLTETLEALNADWRKLATAATQNGQDVEKAFLDQAYTFLQNKAGPIMKTPHRVGFEIVHKNDDNTRMVGIFVFRVGEELFYAPTFFINGSIKGTDLFYRCEQKRFVPLSSGWVSHLMNAVIRTEGQGLPVRHRQQNVNQANLRQLAFPPGYGAGGASFKFASMADIAAPEDVKSMVDHMQAALCGTSLLQRFVKASGGVSAATQLADAAERSFKFANALYVSSPVQDFQVDAVKQAAAPQDLIILHLNPILNKRASTATEDDRLKGFQIEDRRKAANVNTEIYSNDASELGSFETPGVYDVPAPDGSIVKCLVAYQTKENPFESQSANAPWTCSETNWRPNGTSLVAVDPSNGKSVELTVTAENPLFATKVGEIETHESLKAAPTEGKAWRMFNSKSGELSQPFFVIGTEDVNGLTKVKAAWHSREARHEDFTILLNPDYPSFQTGSNIAGACCKFVEQAVIAPSEISKGTPCSPCANSQWVSYDRTLKLGDPQALERFIRGSGCKQATVRLHHDDQFVLQLDGQPTEKRASWIGASLWLMTKCALTQTLAEDLLDQAMTTRDPIAFWHQPAEKIATGLRPSPMPDFDMDVEEYMNAQVEPHTQVIMSEALRNPSDEPQARVDDIYRGENGFRPDNLPIESPLDLFQMSQEHNLPNLFEHGVVGSLVQTYDSIALIERYLPDLETALDCLGRILFLFYWKPEDFSQAYGSDDMAQMENKLLSNFKSFGDLVLDLLKKSNQTQQGSASLN